MHKMYPESRDKTTESLARRARTLFKNQLTVQNFRSCLLECKTDPNLVIPKIGSNGKVVVHFYHLVIFIYLFVLVLHNSLFCEVT